MKLIDLAQSKEAALDGDWVGDLPAMGDFRVKIRSLACPAANAYRTALYKTLGQKLRTRKSRDVATEIHHYVDTRTLIDVCVLDWAGLEIPLDAGGRFTLDPAAIRRHEPAAFSRELLADILLEDAPSGRIVTQPAPNARAEEIRTPDGRQARFAMSDFLGVLLIAADRVSAPDDAGDSSSSPDADEKN